MVEVRKAKLEDAEKLNKILFNLMVRFEKMDSFDKQDRKYWKEKNISGIKKIIRKRDSDFIVIEDGNKIIGAIELIISKREGIFKIKKNGHIETTFIDQKYRGKGYGSMIHDKAMEWFKKKNVKYVTVGTHALDKGANSFWKKQGFKEYNYKYRKTI